MHELASALAQALVQPVHVTKKSVAAERSLIAKLRSGKLNAIAEADAYGDLVERGYTVERLVAATGATMSTIYARLKLLDLLPPARKAVVEGKISPAVGIRVARFRGETQGVALAMVAVRDRWGLILPDRSAAAKLALLKALPVLRQASFATQPTRKKRGAR